jgi:polynucleotide 5'-hydroxyl-kinase GRC3/NOL9
MRYKVERGKTLLVDGPARVQLISGAAEVLGAEIKPETSIIIREGKRLPFEANSEFEAELFLSEQASCVEIDGAAIPDSWRKIAARILSEKGRLTVLILGGVDSGKTGFCIYLANSALRAERKVAVMDCDLGQSDLGPPGTIGLCLVQKPFTDLFRLFPDESVFIGVTSPNRVVNGVLEAAKRLREEALKRSAELLIINTDGWIDGDDAVRYKAGLVEVVDPDYIVAIRVEDELDPLISSLGETRITPVDSPENVKKRDRETRRLLRGFAYKKHLRGSKIRSFPLSWVKVEGSLNLSDERRDQLREKMQELLGTGIICCEETSNSIICILREKASLTEDAVRVAETETGKRILALREGEERGLLVSLESSSGEMLGIGTLHCIDFKNMTIKIRTPVDGQVSKIKVGQIKLDSKGNEEGIIFSDPKYELKGTDD